VHALGRVRRQGLDAPAVAKPCAHGGKLVHQSGDAWQAVCARGGKAARLSRKTRTPKRGGLVAVHALGRVGADNQAASGAHPRRQSRALVAGQIHGKLCAPTLAKSRTYGGKAHVLAVHLVGQGAKGLDNQAASCAQPRWQSRAHVAGQARLASGVNPRRLSRAPWVATRAQKRDRLLAAHLGG
jgi:hypothetical protein